MEVRDQPAIRPASRNRPSIGRLVRSILAELRVFLDITQKLWQIPSGRIGLALVALLGTISILVTFFIPYDPVAKGWTSSGFQSHPQMAKLALPEWVNWFRKDDLPSTIVLDGQAQLLPSKDASGISETQTDFVFDYPFHDFPGEVALYAAADYTVKKPFITLTWITPDGREIELRSGSVSKDFTYPFAENIPVSRLVRANEHLKRWFVTSGSQETPAHYLLFANPDSNESSVVTGEYTLRVKSIFFEEGNNLDAQLVIFGLVQGWAGTDYLRRDLSIPLLWGLPFALLGGVIGATITSLIALVLAAASAWMGGWIDYLVQRATEVNLLLPVMAVSVILYAYFNLSLWLIIGIIMLSSVLGSSGKSYRAALIQEKVLGYIEAAKTYGASDWRIITQYLVRRILPTWIPQVVMLIPGFVFLEATLAIFNISDVRYPTWGRMFYSALRYGAQYGSEYWVLQPLGLMLLTGLAFVLIGFALNRVLIPKLQND